MICPYCGVAIRLEIVSSSIVYDVDQPGHKQYGYDIAHGFCPECSSLIILLRYGDYFQHNFDDEGSRELTMIDNEIVVWPHHGPSRRVELEVLDPYKSDFAEASRVLPISPKASAAISRRILQNILRDNFGIKERSLAQEIDQFIKRPGVPSELCQTVDAIRNVGNFAAHPLKDTNTGLVIDVEPGEAEWLLDVLEALFDFAFVQPKRLQNRKAKLNAKLAAAGKPAMK